MAADTLVLKLVLTPALIAGASLAGRRWGPAIGGWLVGLPLTSGPVAFFLALDQGVGFAAAVAFGSLSGAIGEAAFCLAYGHVALHRGWAASLAAACVAFALVAAAVQRLPLPLAALGAGTFVALVVALRWMPRREGGGATTPPAWDIPARMIVTTVLVVLLTEGATRLGPRLSGVLATFPLYAAVLTVFAHRAGAPPAIQVLRGLLVGLFSFAGFFVVLIALIERAGVAGAFAAAIGAALVIQAASLRLVVRPAILGSR